jgi:hypothetical protein
MRDSPQKQSSRFEHYSRAKPFRELIRASGTAGLLLWLHPLFLAVVFRRRDFEEYATIDMSALLQIGFVCICAVYLASVVSPHKRGLPKILFRPPLCYFFVYVVVCALSSLWSIYPLYTAYRAFECLVFLLLITVALDNLRRFPEDIVEWIVGRAFLCVCCSLIMQRAWIMSVISGGLTPETMRQNGIVAILDVSPVLFLALFISKRKLLKCFLSLPCAISASTRIYMGFVIGLLCGLASDRKKKPHAIPFILGISALLILLVGTTAVIHIFFVGKSQDAIVTGTGRFPFWRTLLELGMKSPLIGKGFSVGERAVTIEEGSSVWQAHNSLIAAFMGCGLLGLVPMMLFFSSMVRLSLRQKVRPEWRTGLVASVVMATFISMFGLGIGGRVYGSWISVTCLAALVTTLANAKMNLYGLQKNNGQMGVT